tara:strand:- start:29 stop:517 length:489 start_codon:yes stop_codon:yes gene_type:complete
MIIMWKGLLKRDLVEQAKQEAIFQTSKDDRKGSRTTMARLAEEYAPEEVADWKRQLQEDEDLWETDDDDDEDLFTDNEDPFKKAVDVSINSIFDDQSREVLRLIHDGPVGIVNSVDDLQRLLREQVYEVLKETKKRIRNHVLSPDWKPRKSSQSSPSTWYQD